MKTRAAVLPALNERLTVEDLNVTGPGPHEVLVRLAATGVCHTDHHVLTGGIPQALPAVLGHEGAGRVEDVGALVTHVKPGDTVVLISVPPCGSCWFCVRGEPTGCELAYSAYNVANLSRDDGSDVFRMAGLGTFAELVAIDAGAVVPVQTDLPLEQLALIGCGVVTGVGTVLSSPVRPGSSVLVIGCGGVGLAAIQGARIAGASTIIASDPAAMKRDAALAVGATAVVDPTGDDVGEVARSLTGGRGIDVAFEVVGSSSLVVDALRATRPGGTTYIIGAASQEDLLEISAAELLMGRKQLVGALFGVGNPQRTIPELVAFAEQGTLDLASLVSRTIGLDEVNDAFDALINGEVLRSVIRF